MFDREQALSAVPSHVVPFSKVSECFPTSFHSSISYNRVAIAYAVLPHTKWHLSLCGSETGLQIEILLLKRHDLEQYVAVLCLRRVPECCHTCSEMSPKYTEYSSLTWSVELSWPLEDFCNCYCCRYLCLRLLGGPSLTKTLYSQGR